MRTSQHIDIAKTVATSVYVNEMNRMGLKRTTFADACAIIAIELIGKYIGVLPDILEPAGGIYHRGIFHSKDAFWFIEKLKNQIRLRPSNNTQIDIITLMALSAYQSHILLDSVTPIGVPDYQRILQFLYSLNKR